MGGKSLPRWVPPHLSRHQCKKVLRRLAGRCNACGVCYGYGYGCGAVRCASLRGGAAAGDAVAGGDLAARGGRTCLGGPASAVGCGLRPSRDCAALLGLGARRRTHFATLRSDSGRRVSLRSALRAPPPALRCSPLPTSRQGKPHRPGWRDPGGWDKHRVTCFVKELASTGHRGRVDARGQRPHALTGLTRTSVPDADAAHRVR